MHAGMDQEAQHEYHVSAQIPVVNVTSPDDSINSKQRKLLREESGNAFQDDYIIQRPTFLPIQFKNHEELEFVVSDSRLVAIGTEKFTDTDKMKPFLKAVISPQNDLSPDTDFDNGFVSSVLALSDAECGRKSGTFGISHILLDDKGESDPSDNGRIGKKSMKSCKKSMKSSKTSLVVTQKDSETASAKHEKAVGELTKASCTVYQEDVQKNGRSKRRKFKNNARGKFAKITKKLSDRQVLSPSYKQKNEDFRKFFKDLPVTERLLVDYACAIVKDILVQGRLYVSQNYLCFHSTILKWQTVVTVNLVDIDQMTKEKTVKVIPNAIQVLLKDKTKMTFTSFTARDRAFLAIFRLWQNALLDQPISAMQLWSQIHRNYGEELGGCSSDDDYVRPKPMVRKHEVIGDDGEFLYQFGTTNKIKRPANATLTLNDYDCGKSNRSSKSTNSSRVNPTNESQDRCSVADDKSLHSSRDTVDSSMSDERAQLVEEDEFSPAHTPEKSTAVEEQQLRSENVDESDDEAAEFLMQNLPKHSFTRIYAVSVRDMHRIIFGDDCPFWRDTLVNKGTTGISFGTWKKDDSTPGQRKRELSYTLRLDNSFGPKTSFVKETQIYYPCSIEGKSYVVDCIAQNYGIPYADYFYTAMRYSIRKVTKTSCQLRITWELRYQKSPWGLVKNFIEKNVASGMSANFKKLQTQLQEQITHEKSASQTCNGKGSTKSNVRRRKLKSVSSTANTSVSRRRSSNEPPDTENDQKANAQDEGSDRERPSSTVLTGVPPVYIPNGFIPNEISTRNNESPKLHYFGQGGKFIFGAMLFLLILLLYSNYNMSQRLNTLEHVTAAAATAEGVDPSVTAALLDRPGVPISSNPEMLTSYLQAIDKRLRRLEDSVTKFTQESIGKWEKIEKQLETMEDSVKKLIKSSLHEGT